MNEYTKKLEAEEQIMNKEKEVAQLQKKLHEITEKYNKKYSNNINFNCKFSFSCYTKYW